MLYYICPPKGRLCCLFVPSTSIGSPWQGIMVPPRPIVYACSCLKWHAGTAGVDGVRQSALTNYGALEPKFAARIRHPGHPLHVNEGCSEIAAKSRGIGRCLMWHHTLNTNTLKSCHPQPAECGSIAAAEGGGHWVAAGNWRHFAKPSK